MRFDQRLATLLVLAVCGSGGRASHFFLPSGGNYILQASGFYILQANGSRILQAHSQ